MAFSYFRTPEDKRGRAKVMLVCAILTVVFLIFGGIPYFVMTSISGNCAGADAARQWKAPDSPYDFAQVSVFLDDQSALDLNTVYVRRTSIAQKLEQQSISSASGSTAWADCFSSESTQTVRSDRAKITAVTTAAGGRFFLLHPFELVSGSYFDENDFEVNTAVIDELAAWQLFGSSDVAGMEIDIGGQTFTVVGVTKLPTDATELAAYGSQPRIYANYIGMRLLLGVDTVTTYEILLPNPISSFAANTVKEVFSVASQQENAYVSATDSRFSMSSLLKGVNGYFKRSMRSDRVIPPWWENAALAIESECILLALFCVIFVSLSAVTFVAVLFLWFSIHPVRARNIYSFIDDRLESHRAKRWYARQKKLAEAEAAAESEELPETDPVPTVETPAAADTEPSEERNTK